MRFLLRIMFWLGVVLVLLPSGGSQPVPKPRVGAGEVFWAAKVLLADIQQLCNRQPEACIAGSQATVTLGQRAQVGAEMLYEFLSEQLESEESGSVRTTGSVPVPPARPSRHMLQPADLVPSWRSPQPTPRRPSEGRVQAINSFARD
jgi:hypothetical protein